MALNQNTIEWIRQTAAAQADSAIEARRHLHSHPELSRQEYQTASFIEDKLREAGLEPRRVGETGVYAEIKGTGIPTDRVMVLRADIDALPIQECTGIGCASQNAGVMHACGHDMHTAALLTAARILATNTDRFGGSIRLIFQQAEEIGYGARVFIREGLCEGGTRAFGIHISSEVPAGQIAFIPGPCNAAVDYFKVQIKGKATHVSQPHKGCDALYIAAQTVVAVQALVTRRTDPLDPVIIGIGRLDAGTAYNIVAADAMFEGTLRTFSHETRARIKADIEAVSRQIAALYGGSVETEWKDFTSPLINDAAIAEELAATTATVLGPDAVFRGLKPTLGGDDMAEILLKVPGVYVQAGVIDDTDSRSALPLHNEKFVPSEKALQQMVAMHLIAALDHLNEGQD